MEASPAPVAPGGVGGFYCSTSGTYFTDKESLTEHYKSDFHRYNLKRKVAGLPPVTREWFDSRKAVLTGSGASSAAGTAVTRVWTDPLTKKKFSSENTYQAHLRSKKYRELLRKEGLAEPPPPVVTLRKLIADGELAAATKPPAAAGPAGYTVKPAVKLAPGVAVREVAQAADHASDMSGGDVSDGDEVDGGGDGGSSGWETASEQDVEQYNGTEAEGAMEAEEEWEAWDVRRSLFDNQMAPTFEANLAYMYNKYGFYLPDAEYLEDPQGLLQYLGQKLRYGRVPLYSPGDDAAARQFRSLHAVQRHMVDSGRCRVAYEGNEGEYEEFYDYARGAEPGEGGAEAEPEGRELAMSDADAPATALGAGGYELVLHSDQQGAAAVKVLGSRDLAMYYRQRHRPGDARASVAAAAVVAQYRQLGVQTREKSGKEGGAEATGGRASRSNRNRLQLKCEMKYAVIHKLPKNCTF